LTPFNTNMVLRYLTSTFFSSSMEAHLLSLTLSPGGDSEGKAES
jgi:hypothetical protein